MPARAALRWLTCMLLAWQPVFIIYFCQWCAPDSLVNAVAAALPVLHPYLILWWALVLLYVPTGLKLMLLIPTGKYNGADPRVMKLQSGPIGSSAWQRQVRVRSSQATLDVTQHTRTRATHTLLARHALRHGRTKTRTRTSTRTCLYLLPRSSRA